MNAYELAEIVDKWAYSESAEYLTDAANMLRQQADRIAELEKQLDVRTKELIGASFYEHDYKTLMEKRLSDEEVHELANKHLRTQDHDGAKVVLGLEDFARAIEERHGIK